MNLFRKKTPEERIAKLEHKLVKKKGARVLLVAKAIHAGQRPAGRVWWDELAPLTPEEREYVHATLRSWRR